MEWVRCFTKEESDSGRPILFCHYSGRLALSHYISPPELIKQIWAPPQTIVERRDKTNLFRTCQRLLQEYTHHIHPPSFCSILAPIQGTIRCTPNSVPMVFIVFSKGFLGTITHKYPLYGAYIGISHSGTLVGVHPTIP